MNLEWLFPGLRLMEYRLGLLTASFNGLVETGVPLVGSNSNGDLYPIGVGDDIGAYYLVPKLAIAFGIDVIAMWKIFIFLAGIASFLVASAGFVLLFRKRSSKWVSVFFVAVLLVFTVQKSQDLYLFPAFAACLIPIVILVVQRFNGNDGRWLYLLAVVVGLVSGSANEFRGHAGTGLLLFTLFAVNISPQPMLKNKIVFTSLLLLFFIPPAVFFDTAVERRDAYLKELNPSYLPINDSNGVWHSAYIGLGYIHPNAYGIEYRDKVAFDKVHSIKPGAVAFSKEYEEILRKEYFKIVKNDPVFYLKTTFKKAAKIIYLTFFRYGWSLINIAALFLLMEFRPPPFVVTAFAISILFNMIPGLLVMPASHYLLGYLLAVGFFSVYVIGSANDDGSLGEAFPFLKGKTNGVT